MIQQNFVDMENMLDLLREEEEIVDLPGVPELTVKEGRLEFRNVSFHYTIEKPILRGVSFCVEPGQTVALVSRPGWGVGDTPGGRRRGHWGWEQARASRL